MLIILKKINMISICVFCGSRQGVSPLYSKLAEKLGHEIAGNKLTLIYGGGKVGLMGEIADAVLSKGGEVVGVIPEFLYHREVAHEGLTKLIVVESMHERKLKMSALADGFIALPGGYGTLEELAEIITWNQLDLVKKPVGILNVNNFYNHLLQYFDHMVNEGFVDQQFRQSVFTEEDVERLLKKMRDFSVDRRTDQLNKT